MTPGGFGSCVGSDAAAALAPLAARDRDGIRIDLFRGIATATSQQQQQRPPTLAASPYRHTQRSISGTARAAAVAREGQGAPSSSSPTTPQPAE